MCAVLIRYLFYLNILNIFKKCTINTCQSKILLNQRKYDKTRKEEEEVRKQ